MTAWQVVESFSSTFPTWATFSLSLGLGKNWVNAIITSKREMVRPYVVARIRKANPLLADALQPCTYPPPKPRNAHHVRNCSTCPHCKKCKELEPKGLPLLCYESEGQ